MIREKQQQKEVVIDLTGPNGNAFALMAYAKQFARQLKMSSAEAERIVYQMQSGDYENLINVFDKHFGEFVILER
jgi:hypothetical protein